MSPQRSKSCYHVALSENKGSAQVWIVSKWIFSPQQVLVTQSKVTNNRVLLEGMQTCSTGWSAVHVCFGQTWTGWHNKHRAVMEHWETEKHATWPYSFPLILFSINCKQKLTIATSAAWPSNGQSFVWFIYIQRNITHLSDGGNKWQYQYIRYCNLWSE